MDAVAAAVLGRSDDGIDIEIAAHGIRGPPADLSGPSCEPGVER